MSVYENIISDYKKAFKEKNVVKKSALSYLISQLKYKEKENLWESLSDWEVFKLIQKEIKSKNETIDYLKKSNNHSELEFELEQLKVLEWYMPKKLSESELLEILDNELENISDLNKERWKVIKNIMSKYWARVDWNLLNELILSKI